MWNLAPWPGIEPVPPASGVLNVSQWTTREVSPSGFNVLTVVWLIHSIFECMEHQNEECEGEAGTGISQAKPSYHPELCFWCGLDHRALPSHGLCAIHPAPQTTQQSSRGCGAHPELVWNDEPGCKARLTAPAPPTTPRSGRDSGPATGQTCHLIFLGASVRSFANECVLSRIWFFSTPGSSIHGISQARLLEWVAISFSRGSSWPRDWTHVSWHSCMSRQVLYH